MDSNRPPPPPPSRHTTATDFFICFTSCHQSSSMKISSNSIFTPCRPRARHPPSLTTSLSRRVRTNRSIRGGAASRALFPTTGKKKRGGFENSEPSSPKVTCIGQVRVKSKKKNRTRLRSLSRRGSVRYHRDIRSSGSCAAVFTRCLVAFQVDERGGRGRRDIEHVVINDNKEEDDENGSSRVSRRHVFEDLEIVDGEIKDEATASICIPPKNALLLMRCGSDPLKMEALANRLRESMSAPNAVEDEEFVDDNDDFDIKQKASDLVESKDNDQQDTERDIGVPNKIPLTAKPKLLKKLGTGDTEIASNEETEAEDTYFGPLFDETYNIGAEIEVEDNYFGSLFDETDDTRDKIEVVDNYFGSLFDEIDDIPEEMVDEVVIEGSDTPEEMVTKSTDTVKEGEVLPECLLVMMYEPKLSMEVAKETWVSSYDFNRRPPPPPQLLVDGQDESKVSATTTTTLLPGVSNYGKQVTAAAAVAAASAPAQVARWSCSLPAPPRMAEMLEHKLMNAVGYEPFVLTRCKSEPMKTAAAKLGQDNCFWKNKKLEPIRRASFGVGAAGIGF